ncbi:MAG TPA: hypothetical protein VKQ32_14175 [Polyangia bacterium]|nr:hypothetical protein [Polyangia bacterium]
MTRAQWAFLVVALIGIAGGCSSGSGTGGGGKGGSLGSAGQGGVGTGGTGGSASGTGGVGGVTGVGGGAGTAAGAAGTSAAGTGGLGGRGGTGGSAGAPACPSTCPAGFSCNTNGECAGGNITSLNFDEVGYAVSGTVTVGGAPPTRDAGLCPGASYALGTITFTDAQRGHSTGYTFYCTNTNSGFPFSVTLPAGTYDVRISSGTGAVNLLSVNYLAGERIKIP